MNFKRIIDRLDECLAAVGRLGHGEPFLSLCIPRIPSFRVDLTSAVASQTSERTTNSRVDHCEVVRVARAGQSVALGSASSKSVTSARAAHREHPHTVICLTRHQDRFLIRLPREEVDRRRVTPANLGVPIGMVRHPYSSTQTRRGEATLTLVVDMPYPLSILERLVLSFHPRHKSTSRFTAQGSLSHPRGGVR